MTALQGPPVVDIALRGTIFLDIVLAGLQERPVPGKEVWADHMSWVPGGVATSAVAARRLGMEVALDAALGNDQPGSFCVNFLQAEGVDLSRVVAVDRTPVTVAIEVAGDRAMVTHEDRAASRSALPWLPASRAVIAQARDPRWWDGSDALVLVDANHDPDGSWDLDELATKLKGASVFTPNRDEALAYCRTDDLRHAAERLAELVPTVVITDGPRGAVGIGEQGCFEVPGIPVPAVDTTGAGDVFCVGLVHGLLAGWPLVEATRFAVACSGLSTTTLGGSAGAPTWAQLKAWLSTSDAETRKSYEHLHTVLGRVD